MKKIIISFLVFFLFFQVFSFYKIIFFDDSKSPWIIFLTDRNWEIITDKQNDFWYKKNWEIDLDSKFVKSLILIEDKNFYSHFWVDFLAKSRAFYSNISRWKIVSGWSTITEQFLKNKYFSTEKRWYFQKMREANLAFFFSIFNSKEKILKNYLENIYFWNNLYGVISASETYFWKNNLNDLDDEEIVILLSLIRYPSIKSLEDKNFLYIFEEIKQKLGFNFERKIKNLKKKENIDKIPFVTKYFCENKFPDCIGKTSIDLDLQNFSENILQKTLKNLSEKNVTNSAVLALKPETMEVLVYLWSSDFFSKKIDWQVDILKNALRQPWSTMKLFLYLQALEKWFSANTLLLDIKSEYDSFLEGKIYFSENYNLKQYWLIRFQKSLWNSLNNATVRLAKEIWLNEVFDFYKKFWIKFLENNVEFYGYSLVLGNNSLTLENLALAYINLIPDFEVKNDRKLNFEFSEKIVNKSQKLDENKYLLYEILKNPDNRDLSFWVNSVLNTSIYQAVKTWTSSNFKDNLVISYNKNFLLLVWVWNNDNSSMKWVNWISWAWNIWNKIIEKAISKNYIKKDNYFSEKIVKKDYCLDKKCFRKEISFDKIDKEYFSFLVEKYFSKKDLWINLTENEEKYLNDLWFFLD